MVHLIPIYLNSHGGKVPTSFAVSIMIWIDFLFICFYLIKTIAFYTKPIREKRLINYLFWNDGLGWLDMPTTVALIINGFAFVIGGALLVNYLFF